MPAGILIDTSFLITLADPTRNHHQAAKKYWRYVTQNAIPIYLSTIVVSEFCIKQQIPDEILRACVVLPFNWDDAIQAASFDFKAGRGSAPRDALKDDVKIIAQALVRDAAWIVTDDTRSFYKFAQDLKVTGKAQFHVIKLEDGFDESYFNSHGQRQLNFSVDDEAETEAEE